MQVRKKKREKTELRKPPETFRNASLLFCGAKHQSHAFGWSSHRQVVLPLVLYCSVFFFSLLFCFFFFSDRYRYTVFFFFIFLLYFDLCCLKGGFSLLLSLYLPSHISCPHAFQADPCIVYKKKKKSLPAQKSCLSVFTVFFFYIHI